MEKTRWRARNRPGPESGRRGSGAADLRWSGSMCGERAIRDQQVYHVRLFIMQIRSARILDSVVSRWHTY